MIDGLWTVEFTSIANRYGKGILVINKNRLLGGDDGYYYTGTCNINNNNITGTINVIRYDQNSISVFGDIDHFELTFSGQIDDNQLNVTGSITNAPEEKIRVAGTKKEDYNDEN